MPKFHVIALDAEGNRSEETVEAADRFAAYRIFRERGSTVVECKEQSRSGMLSLAFLWGFSQRISLDEKVVLARNLAAMLEAGLTVSRALAVVERQTGNRELKTILDTIIADVRKGSSFSVALAPFQHVFSPLMISMARAGEESGKLAESLRVVATQMDRASTLTKQIKGAMIYPAFVIAAMIVISILMLVYVVPTLAATFAQLGTALPPTTAFILAASTFLTTHAFFSVIVALFAATLIILSVHTALGRRAGDWTLLHLPIITGLVVETDCARTARTLASLLSSGVDVVSSLAITREVVGNRYFKNVLAEAGAAVVKGAPLSGAFAKHPELYPPLFSEMIAVGEETGQLSRMLAETAAFYEESVERNTKNLSAIIEPLLILLVGGLVALFAISMIGPIYSLSSSIG
jgi:type IV pilus assembly protein PilC